MKKFLLVITVVFMAALLTACNTATTTNMDNDNKLVADAKAAFSIANADNITANVTLPLTHSNGATYTYESSNTAVFSNTGVVTRPAEGQPDATVVLVVTVRSGLASSYLTVNLTVKALPVSNQAKVDEAKNALQFPVDVANVTGNFSLPATGLNSATITWAVKSGTGVAIGAANQGNFPVTVTRPNPEDPDATVVLTATLTVGDKTATKEFTLTIIHRAVTDQEKLAEAVTVFQNDMKKINLLFVRSAVTLPTVVQGDFGFASVTWVSANPALISNAGVPNIPADQNATTKLTATVTVGAATQNVEFNVVVIAASSTYTWRDTTVNPDTLNPHQYQMAEESAILQLFMASPYKFDFDESGTGYVLRPEMAESDPVDVSPEGHPGTVWDIHFRKDLRWSNGERINADDFMYSWQMLMDPKLQNYRGDAFYNGMVVVNAEAYFKQGLYKGCQTADGLDEYTDEDYCVTSLPESFPEGETAADYTIGTVVYWPEISFDQVGIKKIDDYTIELTMVNRIDAWHLKYNMSSFVVGTVYKPLYEAGMNEDRTATTYGTDITQVMSDGIYVMSTWQNDKVFKFSRNEYYAGKDQIAGNVENVQLDVIADQSVRLEMFKTGQIELTGLSGQNYLDYQNDPRLKYTETSQTWRLTMNTVARPDGKTSPIMLLPEFRKALFFALDRQKFIDEVLKIGYPSETLIATAYIGDLDNGIPYRDFDQAKHVVDDLYPATFGYNKAEAQRLFVQAYNKLVADGTINSGDTVTIEMLNYTSETSIRNNKWVKDELEAAFNSTELGPNVFVVDVQAVTDRYTRMENGNFDVAWAAWSGAELDPWNLMQVYADPVYRNEYGFDENTTNVTVNINGVDVTHTFAWWFQEVNYGEYQFVDQQIRIDILAAMESEFIHQFQCVPLFQARGAVIYQNRVQTRFPEYNMTMGWGNIEDFTLNQSDQEFMATFNQ